jgi:hypothetical protein
MGRAPRCCPAYFLVPSQAGVLTPSSPRKIGGRDGCCPRCFLLDRQASPLFLFASFQDWCGVPVMLRTGPDGRQLYRLGRVFNDLPPPMKVAGRGLAPRRTSF